MNFKRGDVVLVLFPDSNLRSAKRRPALVVQADRLQSGLPQKIVAMITSNMRRAGHVSRVSVTLASPAGKQSGLKTDSANMTDNLVMLRHTEIERVLGRLELMADVDAALRATLAL